METRERLIEAMSVSLRLRGYGSTAMKDVIADADATAGSMYHHFPDGKEQLAVAAVHEVGRSRTEDLRAVIDAASSVSDAAVAFFGALLNDMEISEFRYGCPIGVPATETATIHEAVRAAAADVFASWVEAMSSGLQREGWSPEDAEQAARFAVSAYEGASALARATHDASYISDSLEFVRKALDGTGRRQT